MIVFNGVVIKKVRHINPSRGEVFIQDQSGEQVSLLLKGVSFKSFDSIDVGSKVKFSCKNKIGKAQKNSINNFIVKDAQVL